MQLLGSGYILLDTVSKGWVGRFVVYGFTLGHVLGTGWLRAVSEGVYGLDVVSLGNGVLRAGLVDGFNVKEIVNVLRGRVDSLPGPWVVKWVGGSD